MSGSSLESFQKYVDEHEIATSDLGVEHTLNTIAPVPIVSLFPWLRETNHFEQQPLPVGSGHIVLLSVCSSWCSVKSGGFCHLCI